jgi:CheY-like chemotaxis protein
VDAWLTKPVRQAELIDTILLAIDGNTENLTTADDYSTNNNYNFKGYHLLLVEDNEINQEIAVAILQDSGFSVDVSNNGLEALSAIVDYDYDAVLMDIQMPYLDGLKTTEKIREMGDKYLNLPIIAMTAHALSSDKEKSLAAGMNDHITKPIHPEDLLKKLSQWLNA